MPGGSGLDAEYILPLVQMIAGMQRRVLLLEPRGTGASRALLADGAQWTVAGSVADVEAVRQAAGVKKVTLLGHSFGGASYSPTRWRIVTTSKRSSCWTR